MCYFFCMERDTTHQEAPMGSRETRQRIVRQIVEQVLGEDGAVDVDVHHETPGYLELSWTIGCVDEDGERFDIEIRAVDPRR